MRPTETAQKGRYAFSFPLKPGESQFQVSYHMPYKGEASFSPKPLAEVQHFVVMTPQGMTFAPKDKQRYQSMPDNSGAGVMVATNVKPGEDLSFTLSGTGQFQAEGQQAAGGDEGSGGAMGGGQAVARDNRPGGGLGAPIDSNDPLHDYRAVILGVFACVLVMGGAYVIAKSNDPLPAVAVAGAAAAATVADEVAPRDRNAKLLEAMEEELFSWSSTGSKARSARTSTPRPRPLWMRPSGGHWQEAVATSHSNCKGKCSLNCYRQLQGARDGKSNPVTFQEILQQA